MSLRLVFAFCMAAALPAQQPGAAEILGQVARSYREMHSAKVEATLTLKANSNAMRIEIPIIAARRGRGEMRVEATNSMMATKTISDGKHVWKYADRFQQYTKKPVATGMAAAMQGPGRILAGDTLMDGLKDAKLLRQEEVSVSGEAIKCDVVEALYVLDAEEPTEREESRTYWVDRRRGLILKMSYPLIVSGATGGRLEMTGTITVTSIQLDQPLADALFVFTPPAGAREVEEFTPVATTAQGAQRER